LRSVRRTPSESSLNIAAADPLNLVGIVLPGARVSPLASQNIELAAGFALRERTGA